MKFDKKAIRNTEICKKILKNKQILIKASNPQVFKKNANPQKNKPKFAGKPQGWQHWPTTVSATSKICCHVIVT